jgi:hypothetical protein
MVWYRQYVILTCMNQDYSNINSLQVTIYQLYCSPPIWCSNRNRAATAANPLAPVIGKRVPDSGARALNPATIARAVSVFRNEITNLV